MKTKLRKLPPVILCLLFAVFLVKSPESAAKCVTQSLKLIALKLIPSLFPFFVLSALLRGVGIARILSRIFGKPFRLFFGVSGVGAFPLISGFTGGYPVGVKTVCDMHGEGEITTQEASRLLLFCGNTGPAFILGAAGSVLFASSKIGFILYITHIVSALIIGVGCRVFFGEIKNSPLSERTFVQSFAKTFTDAVSDSAFACLNITAYVVLFSVFAELLQNFGFTDFLCAASGNTGFDPVYTKAVFTGFLELGSGLDALSPFARNLSFALPACAFMLGWGGVSVHCQALSFISRENLPCRGYLLSKLLHGILSAIQVSLFLRSGGIESVFSFWGHETKKAFIFDYLGLFFSFVCALAALILHIIRKLRVK